MNLLRHQEAGRANPVLRDLYKLWTEKDLPHQIHDYLKQIPESIDPQLMEYLSQESDIFVSTTNKDIFNFGLQDLDNPDGSILITLPSGLTDEEKALLQNFPPVFAHTVHDANSSQSEKYWVFVIIYPFSKLLLGKNDVSIKSIIKPVEIASSLVNATAMLLLLNNDEGKIVLPRKSLDPNFRLKIARLTNSSHPD